MRQHVLLVAASLLALTASAAEKQGVPPILDEAVRKRLAVLDYPSDWPALRPDVARALETLSMLQRDDLSAADREALLRYAADATKSPSTQESTVVPSLRRQLATQLKSQFLNAPFPSHNRQRWAALRSTWGEGTVPFVATSPPPHQAQIQHAQRTLYRLLEDGRLEDYRQQVKAFVASGYPSQALEAETVRRDVTQRLRSQSHSAVSDRRLRAETLMLGTNYYRVVLPDSDASVPEGELVKLLAGVGSADSFRQVALACQEQSHRPAVQRAIWAAFERSQDSGLLFEIAYCIIASRSPWSKEFFVKSIGSDQPAHRVATAEVMRLWGGKGAVFHWQSLLVMIARANERGVDEAICEVVRSGLGPTARLSERARAELAVILVCRLDGAQDPSEVNRLLSVAEGLGSQWPTLAPALLTLAEKMRDSDGTRRLWNILGSFARRDATFMEQVLSKAGSREARAMVLEGAATGMQVSPRVVAIMERELEGIASDRAKAAVKRFLDRETRVRSRQDGGGFLLSLEASSEAIHAQVESVRGLSAAERRWLVQSALRIRHLAVTAAGQPNVGRERRVRLESVVARCDRMLKAFGEHAGQ